MGYLRDHRLVDALYFLTQRSVENRPSDRGIFLSCVSGPFSYDGVFSQPCPLGAPCPVSGCGSTEPNSRIYGSHVPCRGFHLAKMYFRADRENPPTAGGDASCNFSAGVRKYLTAVSMDGMNIQSCIVTDANILKFQCEGEYGTT